MMETEQLHSQKVGELLKLCRQLETELEQARFKHATQQLQNPNKLLGMRREIARIKTIVAQKVTKARSEKTVKGASHGK